MARRIEAHCVSPRRYRKQFEFENVTMALTPQAALDAVHLRATVHGLWVFGSKILAAVLLHSLAVAVLFNS